MLRIIILTLVLIGLTYGQNCPTFKSEDEEREFNKRLVLNFYNEAFNPPQNFGNAVRKYFVKDGYIQHHPAVRDGQDHLISIILYNFRNITTNPLRHTENVMADGDLVWVHDKEVNPAGDVNVVVNIHKIKCGKLVERWVVSQTILPNSAFANGHPVFRRGLQELFGGITDVPVQPLQ